jgi:hypothetical protein
MSANGKMWLTCRMLEQHYNDLKLHKFPEVQILSIEPEYDYSHDEQWLEFKRDAGKAYKAKKEREQQIRNENK